MAGTTLIPAGYLPRLAPYRIFKYYEELRQKTGAGGFEYLYMVDQEPQKVIQSPIGRNIIGVHGPWTQLNQTHSIENFVFSRLIVDPTKVALDLAISAQKTLQFAHTLRAKYVVFHTVDLNPADPEEFLKEMLAQAKKLNLQIYLECDLKRPGLAEWYYNTAALWEKFHVPVVFDPATTELNGEDILEEWEKVAKHVGHVHLNEYQPRLHKDQGVMKSPKYAKLLQAIAKSGYSGYFTFEVGPIQSQKDKILAAIYFAAAFTGLANLFPAIYAWFARLSMKNLADSITFSAASFQTFPASSDRPRLQ